MNTNEGIERLRVHRDGSFDYLRDSRLSLRAKGLLAIALELGSSCELSEGLNAVRSVAKDGGTALRTIANELKAAGYAEQERVMERGRSGVKYFRWIVYESLSLKQGGDS